MHKETTNQTNCQYCGITFGYWKYSVFGRCYCEDCFNWATCELEAEKQFCFFAFEEPTEFFKAFREKVRFVCDHYGDHVADYDKYVALSILESDVIEFLDNPQNAETIREQISEKALNLFKESPYLIAERLYLLWKDEDEILTSRLALQTSPKSVDIETLAEEAFNEAVAHIQKRLNQNFGDVAGIFFSDEEKTSDPIKAILADYIKCEILNGDEN